jgi:hypothetical protein
MKKRIVLLLSFFLLVTAKAQEKPGLGPKEKSVRSEMRSRKMARKEDREKRKLEKEEKKAIAKHHKRIQTKAVRKRMKTSQRKAQRHQDNKRDPFFQRMFQKKNSKKARSHKKD